MANPEKFWLFYLSQHTHPTSRRLHFLGTGLTFVFLGLAIVSQNAWFLLGMPVCGYAFAWIGHFVFEKNRPATFKYPFQSLYSDYKMFFLTLTGRMDVELERLKTRSHDDAI